MKRKKVFTVYHRKRGAFTVIIDAEDWPRVKEYDWFYSPERFGKDAYIYTTVVSAIRTRKAKLLKLHRFIMRDVAARTDIGHIDKNPLNNQKSNLFVYETYNRKLIER